MKKLLWMAGIGFLGTAGFIISAAVLASQNRPAAQAEYHSIVQAMRQQGFRHKTASWTNLSTQTTEEGKITKSESRVWISDNQYRLETQDKQNGKKIVLLDTGQEKYLFTPEEKKAIKWGQSLESMYAGLLNSDTVTESLRQRKQAKKVGSELLEGNKACNIFSYSSTVTFMNTAVTCQVKEWVWARYDFPIKSEVQTPRHKMQMALMIMDVPASTTVNVVENLVLNKPVDPTLFQLPVDTKIETLDLPPKGSLPNAAQNSQAVSEEKKPDASQSEPPADVQKKMKNLF